MGQLVVAAAVALPAHTGRERAREGESESEREREREEEKERERARESEREREKEKERERARERERERASERDRERGNVSEEIKRRRKPERLPRHWAPTRMPSVLQWQPSMRSAAPALSAVLKIRKILRMTQRPANTWKCRGY